MYIYIYIIYIYIHIYISIDTVFRPIRTHQYISSRFIYSKILTVNNSLTEFIILVSCGNTYFRTEMSFESVNKHASVNK